MDAGQEIVAFVGGGGKTSLMFALAAELPGRAVITTTTRIFAAQQRLAPAVVMAGDLSPLAAALEQHGRCLVVGGVKGDKALGVDPDLPARLLVRDDVDYVLVEADGSRMRPVKAPADHEPVIPMGTTLLVPVAGLDALEGAVGDVAHRAERVREVTSDELRVTSDELRVTSDELRVTSDERRVTSKEGTTREWAREERGMIGEGDRLTAAGLAWLLTHPRGGLKDAPDGARIVPVLNKAETAERQAAGREAATLMLAEPRVSRVVLTAMHDDAPVKEVWRRVTAVVLAAGLSSRMGRNKLLLPWGDTTVLGQTLANVMASGVSGIMVVTGHQREETEEIANESGVTSIQNLDYAKGMLTSVQTAVRHLPQNVEAVLVVLGDQPLVGPGVIDGLLRAYAGSAHGLVAPVYRGRRGNPVLIDRRYFVELLALPPEAAPRVLLQRHEDDLYYVEIADDAILHDLDRPEDYERLRPR